MRKIWLKSAVSLGLAAILLAACNGPDVQPTIGRTGRNNDPGYGKVFGDLVIYRAGGKDKEKKGKEDDAQTSSDQAALTQNRNRFLWQASLESVSFANVTNKDPISGIIITDWYQDAQSPNERFKFSIVIDGKEIRSQNLRVRLFKQIKDKSDHWVDVDADNSAAAPIAATILARAHKLAQIAGEDTP